MITIIAEIGLNHLGSLETAKQLATMSADCGADVVKSQLICERLSHDPEAEALFERCRLTDDEWREWCDHVRSLGKEPLFSVFDKPAVAMAVDLGCERLKIASPDIVNRALIEEAAATGLPLIVSTGAADYDEVDRCAEMCRAAGAEKMERVTFLHCVSDYPTSVGSASVNALREIADVVRPSKIGLSDHSPPGETIPAVMAVALGATVIERHVRGWYKRVPDHDVSDNPDQFANYVQAIRKAESAMGDGVKRVHDCEQDIRKYARRGADGLRPRRNQ